LGGGRNNRRETDVLIEEAQDKSTTDVLYEKDSVCESDRQMDKRDSTKKKNSLGVVKPKSREFKSNT
jgi:hypothetical protein